MVSRQYTLSIEFGHGYLFARAHGKRTRATVTAITMEVFEVAKSRDFPKALIDVRELDGQLSVLDSYLIVTQVFEKLRGNVLRKAAILDTRMSSIRGWFIETVARNRGFNFRVFAGLQEAQAWLEA